MSKANILNRVLNKSPPVKQAPQTPLGAAGYDNPRENIDPHIKTKVVDALEFYLEGEDISDLFVNTSGGDTMDAPLRINGTNTGAAIDKYHRIFEGASEVFYVGNYLGFTGIVNPTTGTGSIFFGMANDAGTVIESFNLCQPTTLTIGAPTSILFNIGFFNNEATMTADNLAFANGADLNWAVNGELRLLDAHLSIETVGKGIDIKEGTNARMGQEAVMGSATVSTTAVATNSRIWLQIVGNPSGGKIPVAFVDNIVNGTSFDIVVLNADDGSENSDEWPINWDIQNPA